MKKIICILFVFAFMLGFAACGKESEEPVPSDAGNTSAAVGQNGSSVDVDLTQLSSTMIYSEVYNMMTKPEDYIGKTVKMKGNFNLFSDEAQQNYYYACVIQDATACCSQGLEFILAGNKKYPDDYPKENEEITVTGVFETYFEGESRYCHLIDATLSA